MAEEGKSLDDILHATRSAASQMGMYEQEIYSQISWYE